MYIILIINNILHHLALLYWQLFYIFTEDDIFLYHIYKKSKPVGPDLLKFDFIVLEEVCFD